MALYNKSSTESHPNLEHVKWFWSQGLRILMAEFTSFVEIEENFAARYIEKHYEARDYFKKLRATRQTEKQIVCKNLPFAIQVYKFQHRQGYGYLDSISMKHREDCKPFTVKEMTAANSVKYLINFDLITLNRLYHEHRGDNLKIRCGPNGFRRAYRYEDIIMAFIFNVIEKPIEFGICLDDVQIDPAPYCRQCQLRLFAWMSQIFCCDLCEFVKNTRFSTSIFEIEEHFSCCTGDDPKLPRDKSVDSFLNLEPEPQTEEKWDKVPSFDLLECEL